MPNPYPTDAAALVNWRWRRMEQETLWFECRFVRINIFERADGWTFTVLDKKNGAMLRPGRMSDRNRKKLEYYYPDWQSAARAAYPIWRKMATRHDNQLTE